MWLARPGWADASSTCPNGATLAVVAHEDDSILFMNPDLTHDIQGGKCVRTVFVTAGDAGQGQSYWSSREKAAEAAYAEMAGVADTWTQSDAGISGHPMPLMTLAGNPRITLIFMRLPDGNTDGSGWPADGNQSLEKLYNGTISSITAVDNSSSYTRSSLTTTLTSMMTTFAPDRIDTQNYVGALGDGDHSDHHITAYLTRDASRAYTTVAHTLVGYQGYGVEYNPVNVSGADLTAKEATWMAYAPLDPNVCQTVSQCQQTVVWLWMQHETIVGTEAGGPGVSYAPTANPGPDQTVATGSTVQLDGSASVDPNANPTYQWTQTAGPSVSLSSATAVKPTFTAPSSAGTLTFQLVVSDGGLSSAPETVTITVAAPTANVALMATATASSQNTSTGQLASKAIDGVIDGYPGDYTKEWATNGGGAGSWLKLVWNSPQTINRVVLYDRPNLSDQVTGGTLTFSDGSTVPVPALNNDGTATTVTFPAVTTTSVLLTITSVSPTTGSVGLAEIQAYGPQAVGPLTVTGTSPSARSQGAGAKDITITGTGFVNGAQVSFSNSGITVNSTTFVSATQLTANVTVAGNAATGAGDVTITNPDATTATGKGVFTVDAPPVVTSTSPSSLGQTSTNQNVTINGTGFASGASASFSGSGITVNSTTYVDSTHLTVNLTVSATAATSASDVTVTNTDGGVGTGPGVFNVTAPTPTVSVAAANPGSIAQGASGNVTITGANFVSGAKVSFSNSGITVNSTTFVSATQLTANVTVAGNAATGAGDVTVVNPDFTTGTGSGIFTVNATPSVSSTTPSSLVQSSTNQNVTINGTGFASGAVASFSGTGITVNSTTYVNATDVTANVTIAPTAAGGARDVTVTNADGGVGTGTGMFQVTTPTTNLAPLATVSASSENASTGQLASKAIDGVIDGYPGDYTKEWATVGGGVGSWLQLVWSTPQTVSRVVLYDRPNLNDQITGATLTFSDGTTVPVSALNNDGTATTITFPAVNTTSVLLTVTSVSGTTQNVGLSEIQVYTS